MKKYATYILFFLIIIVNLCNHIVWARDNILSPLPQPNSRVTSEIPDISPDEPRHTIVHNCGDFYTVFSNGRISSGFAEAGGNRDPETGDLIQFTTYPYSSNDWYIYGGSFWVGGIVGTDTLVSVGLDGWLRYAELTPIDVEQGGATRTGNFADDEFLTVVVDTNPVSNFVPHRPIGLEIKMASYSWADTAYDDFVILDFVVKNIGQNDMADGWIGFYIDCDVSNFAYGSIGYADDCSGALDTLLYDSDTASRVLIPYSFDNDGDPSYQMEWDNGSIQGVMSIRLLGSSFEVEDQNFNWWFTNGDPFLDFGPRRLGTTEDPLRLFGNDNLGTPVTNEDMHYLMSHPEVDYNTLETAVHDSSTGWIPPWSGSPEIFADGYDTRFLFSFGSFDLSVGDSVMFAVALVAGDHLHGEAGDYANFFNPQMPDSFQNLLDFSQLLANHRRADSVYRSGYTLPHPGPPTGLAVTEFDDGFVRLVWSQSRRPDLGGYYLFVKDTMLNNSWDKVYPFIINDTVAVFSVYAPKREYLFALSLVDTLGRESDLSFPVSVIPGTPHPPENLSASLEGTVPVVTWTPHLDSSLQVFMIYRASWGVSYELYDSTAALIYKDYGAESGVRYDYMISTKNDLELESPLCGPVSVIPMALDQGVLFYNMNRYTSSQPGPYPREIMEQLYRSVATAVPVSRHDVDDGELTFKKMADYSLIIFERENLPRSAWISEDSLANYFAGGGNALFIVPAFGNMGTSVVTHRYFEGDFYHDILKLDSNVNNGIVIADGGFAGDLDGCGPLTADYSALTADPNKLARSGIPIQGSIPMSGYLFPTAEAEPIYDYISSNPDTVNHGQINGIRYIGEEYSFVIFDFPLMLMKEPTTYRMLRQALTDLGVYSGCGDVNGDWELNVGDIVILIQYLYLDGPEPSDLNDADVDCNGIIDTSDIVAIINFVFRNGPWLNCCH